MSPRHLPHRRAAVVLLLALVFVGSSCAKAVATGPQAWIDSPADGATVPPGSPVPVVCRASAPKGVAEVLLEVNGAPYRSMPLADAGDSCAVTIDWLPAEPGPFTLQVTAYDRTGVGSTPATVFVTAEGVTSASPTETPIFAATATATEDAEPAPTPTVATATPEPTAEPTVTPSATPFPPAEVSFTVEQGTVDAGQCTTLHWSVQYVTAVYLDGEGVAGEGSREVCPPETTTYNLHVEAPGGNVDRAVTVGVVIVAVHDGTAPPVPRLEWPGTGESLTAAVCPIKVPLEWSPVTDPSGVVYQVRLRVKDGATWRTVGDWDTDATAHKVQLECDRKYQWGVRACDGAGNCSNWAQADFVVVTP
jgi:hypothetical protein